MCHHFLQKESDKPQIALLIFQNDPTHHFDLLNLQFPKGD